MNQLFDLNGKVAVVTGGYGHLGTSMVKALSDFGATVIVAGRSEEKFIRKFGSEDSKVIFKNCDILESSSICKMFSEVEHTFGGIDILINNAATLRGQNPESISDEDWSFSLDAVLGSVHKGIREAIPFLRKRGGGKIINISSMYGMVSPDFKLYEGEGCEAFLNPPHYGAAKAGILQLTRYYASLLGKEGIRVNTITPGPFPGDHVKQANPEFIERLKNKNPLGLVGKPEDLNGVCVLLSSSASDFITGQNFVVDGGWTSI